MSIRCSPKWVDSWIHSLSVLGLKIISEWIEYVATYLIFSGRGFMAHLVPFPVFYITFTVKKTLAYVKVCVGGDGGGAVWANMCTLPSHTTEFSSKPRAHYLSSAKSH